MIISIADLYKNRRQGKDEEYTLLVPELNIQAGDKILITGPSGSGKSTILDLIGMVLRPEGASRFIFAPDSSQLTTSASQSKKQSFDVATAWWNNQTEALALWRRRIGYVLQTGGLLPFLQVEENILLPRRLLGLKNDNTVIELAQELGIRHLLKSYPNELSVGERQRAAIARALAADPALILADEPTAALDPEHASIVTELFMRMVTLRGLTLIMVTHAPELVQGKGFIEYNITRSQNTTDGYKAILLPAETIRQNNLSMGIPTIEKQPEHDPMAEAFLENKPYIPRLNVNALLLEAARENFIEKRKEAAQQTSPSAKTDAQDTPKNYNLNQRKTKNSVSEKMSSKQEKIDDIQTEENLGDLGNLAALAMISGMASAQDLQDLTDNRPASDWKNAQATWKGLDEEKKADEQEISKNLNSNLAKEKTL